MAITNVRVLRATFIIAILRGTAYSLAFSAQSWLDHGQDSVCVRRSSKSEVIVPIVVDAEGPMLAGRGRYLAAHHLGLDSVPTILVEHLTPERKRAFAFADNRLTTHAVTAHERGPSGSPST